MNVDRARRAAIGPYGDVRIALDRARDLKAADRLTVG